MIYALRQTLFANTNGRKIVVAKTWFAPRGFLWSFDSEDAAKVAIPDAIAYCKGLTVEFEVLLYEE